MFQTAVPGAKVGQVSVLMLNLHGLKRAVVSFFEGRLRWTFDPGFLTIKTFIAMPFFAVLISILLATAGWSGSQIFEENQLDKPTQERPEYIITDINTP